MEVLVSYANLIAIAGIVILTIYWIHIFIILYHLIRFGVGTRPKQAAFALFAMSSWLFIMLILSALSIIFL